MINYWFTWIKNGKPADRRVIQYLVSFNSDWPLSSIDRIWSDIKVSKPIVASLKNGVSKQTNSSNLTKLPTKSRKIKCNQAAGSLFNSGSSQLQKNICTYIKEKPFFYNKKNNILNYRKNNYSITIVKNEID